MRLGRLVQDLMASYMEQPSLKSIVLLKSVLGSLANATLNCSIGVRLAQSGLRTVKLVQGR